MALGEYPGVPEYSHIRLSVSRRHGQNCALMYLPAARAENFEFIIHQQIAPARISGRRAGVAVPAHRRYLCDTHGAADDLGYCGPVAGVYLACFAHLAYLRPTDARKGAAARQGSSASRDCEPDRGPDGHGHHRRRACRATAETASDAAPDGNPGNSVASYPMGRARPGGSRRRRGRFACIQEEMTLPGPKKAATSLNLSVKGKPTFT